MYSIFHLTHALGTLLSRMTDESREGSGLYYNVTEAASTKLNKCMKMKHIDINDDYLTFWTGQSSELSTLSSERW